MSLKKILGLRLITVVACQCSVRTFMDMHEWINKMFFELIRSLPLPEAIPTLVFSNSIRLFTTYLCSLTVTVKCSQLTA